jgi:RNA polymerase sigma-70 factor (ECF subfamily)
MDPDFTRIWADFRAPIKGFISRRIANESDVEDVLQDVFEKVYKNLDDLKDAEKITSWVYRIARNSVIDHYRKHNKAALQIPEDLTVEQPDDKSANKEIASCLTAMISCLPEKYREAITLTEFENYTLKDLSKKMGLSLSGAKSRVQRARKQLKEMLVNCCQMDFDHLGNIVDYKHKTDNCKFC